MSYIPVPEEDEAVDVVAAAMGAVLRAVGDGLANLAGFGGVAGGVEDVFGFSDDFAFGFASVVVNFAFSSVGFFALAGAFCFVRNTELLFYLLTLNY